jgi:hypothetical protein
MYGLSGVQMSYPAWFRGRPAVTEREVVLMAGSEEPRAELHAMMAQGVVRGEIGQTQTNEGGFTARVTVPGTTWSMGGRAGAFR